jgi:hypothetical protein
MSFQSTRQKKQHRDHDSNMEEIASDCSSKQKIPAHSGSIDGSNSNK